jgi:uncharacterized membrane protein YsdA (DUF1294 family)
MIYYLIIVNVITFIVCGYDKLMAIKHLYRIPEDMLLFLSFIGGCLGFIIGMLIFRHKTKKIKFTALEPIFLGMWIYIVLRMI